jgi:flagellin-like hook-associated protein FlgL
LSRGFSFTASTSSTGTNQAEDIRDDLFDQLDAAKTIPGFQNNGSNVFDVQKIGTNQIKITGQNIGDTFNLWTAVDTDPDFLNDTQNVANISPFSIERSIEYLDSMLSQNAAEQSRLNHSHTRLQDEMVATESAQERLSSADYARESTQLARESISMQMASEVISKSMRLKDLLIPLTTSHHRGSVLNAGI